MVFNNDFESIPTRSNGQAVDSTWWNYLQIAGASLESLIAGPGSIGVTKVSIANNQIAAANLAGFYFDAAVNTSARAEIEILITTSSQDLIFHGWATLLWRSLTNSWDIVVDGDGDATGVTLSVSTAGTVGQVQYVSTGVAGTGYVGTVKFKAAPFGI